MTIHQGTYERLGAPFADASERATLALLEALRVAGTISVDAGYVSSAVQARLEEASVKAAAEFAREAREWMDRELADAYLAGVARAEAVIVETRLPVQQGLAAGMGSTPLAPASGGTTGTTPVAVAARFRDYPDHVTLYEAFRAAAEERTERMRLQILRAHKDLYRDLAIQVGEVAYQEAGRFTRLDMSQQLFRRFMRRGIAHIQYSDGRLVDIDVYASMIGRTMTARAAVQGALSRYEQHGYDLVIVSAHFRCCEKCAPFEGRVLSQSGQDTRRPSLASAVRDGLLHPNCRHALSPHFPGLTERPRPTLSPEEQLVAEEHGLQKARAIVYEAEQTQRAIERSIRRAKRNGAISGRSGEVRKLQREMREHLQAHPYLPRKYVREQVARGH